MLKRMIHIGFIMLIFVPKSANAQEENCQKAQDFFQSYKDDCKSVISAHNCIHLDVTDSYDFQGKEFTFLWKMSDGSELEGMEINYCFPGPGIYTATLSLMDPLTKATIKDEASVNIQIKGEFKLELGPSKMGEVDKSVAFKYDLTYPESTHEIEEVYWYFDDGTFSCQKSPNHTFDLPGKYNVRLLMTLSSKAGSEVLCRSETIEIKLPDPSEGVMKNLFNSIPPSSRFLADNIYYKVITNADDRYSEIINFDSLSGEITYQLVAFRGDLFFGSPKIITKQEDNSNDIKKNINSNAIELTKSQPYKLESIIFELDQEDLSKKNRKTLNQNIDLLTDFPMLHVSIGVYTHSKGSVEKGVEYSIKRAELIKIYLEENGIAPERIEVANPNQNRSLINSCVTGSNCDYADATLNRRADFKIINKIN